MLDGCDSHLIVDKTGVVQPAQIDNRLVDRFSTAECDAPSRERSGKRCKNYAQTSSAGSNGATCNIFKLGPVFWEELQLIIHGL